MQRQNISTKQGVMMIAMFLLGTTVLVSAGVAVKQDIWIAFLLGLGVSTVLTCLYARMMSHMPGKDIYDILETLLGRPLAVIFLIFMGIYLFMHYSYVIRHFGDYINIAGLSGTPLLASMLSLGLLNALAVFVGIEVLGKWAEWFLILAASFIIVATLLLTQDMNIDNLRPVLESGFVPIAKATWEIVLFPFSHIIAFLFVLPPMKTGKEPYRILIWGLLLGGALSFIPSITNVLVQGGNTVARLFYPTYSTWSIVQIGNYIQRLEILATTIFTITVFMKTTILLLGTVKTVANILKLDRYGFIVFPVILLAINYGLNAYSGNLEHQTGITIFVPYFSTFFQIIIPVLLFILLEWKAARQKRKHRQQNLLDEPAIGVVSDTE